jgi:hypothetical protein
MQDACWFVICGYGDNERPGEHTANKQHDNRGGFRFISKPLHAGGTTFSIRGAIYPLLALYAIFRQASFQKTRQGWTTHGMARIGFLFVQSSIANTVWILAWHYENITLSLVLKLVNTRKPHTDNADNSQTKAWKRWEAFCRLPFSIYFGWITIATTANATVLPVSPGWDAYGIPKNRLWLPPLYHGVIITTAAGILIFIPAGLYAAFGKRKHTA